MGHRQHANTTCAAWNCPLVAECYCYVRPLFQIDCFLGSPLTQKWLILTCSRHNVFTIFFSIFYTTSKSHESLPRERGSRRGKAWVLCWIRWDSVTCPILYNFYTRDNISMGPMLLCTGRGYLLCRMFTASPHNRWDPQACGPHLLWGRYCIHLT